jgi:C4-dicarboxylate-specific signal transduction histidine kinase
MEKRYIRKDGSLVWVNVNMTVIRDAAGQPTRTVAAIEDITVRKQAEAALEKAHQELIDASRQAGMAEFATGVLHNIGNVLNSVGVASTYVADSLRRSKSASLAKVVALLRDHQADLGDFLTNDPKGKSVFEYLAQLAGQLAAEQAAVLQELAGLQKNIAHIKDVVSTQQSMAIASGVAETLSLTELVEDAVRMNANNLAHRGIQVIRQFEEVPPSTIEKNKVLQILVNLVRNAEQAFVTADQKGKALTLRVTRKQDRVRVAISDNGVGIPPENLEQIFTYGFTTKKDGHGFGLCSCAVAAREMGGSLTVHSDGPGQGATFTLEISCSQPGGLR